MTLKIALIFLVLLLLTSELACAEVNYPLIVPYPSAVGFSEKKELTQIFQRIFVPSEDNLTPSNGYVRVWAKGPRNPQSFVPSDQTGRDLCNWDQSFEFFSRHFRENDPVKLFTQKNRDCAAFFAELDKSKTTGGYFQINPATKYDYDRLRELTYVNYQLFYCSYCAASFNSTITPLPSWRTQDVFVRLKSDAFMGELSTYFPNTLCVPKQISDVSSTYFEEFLRPVCFCESQRFYIDGRLSCNTIDILKVDVSATILELLHTLNFANSFFHFCSFFLGLFIIAIPQCCRICWCCGRNQRRNKKNLKYKVQPSKLSVCLYWCGGTISDILSLRMQALYLAIFSCFLCALSSFLELTQSPNDDDFWFYLNAILTYLVVDYRFYIAAQSFLLVVLWWFTIYARIEKKNDKTKFQAIKTILTIIAYCFCIFWYFPMLGYFVDGTIPVLPVIRPVVVIVTLLDMIGVTVSSLFVMLGFSFFGCSLFRQYSRMQKLKHSVFHRIVTCNGFFTYRFTIFMLLGMTLFFVFGAVQLGYCFSYLLYFVFPDFPYFELTYFTLQYANNWCQFGLACTLFFLLMDINAICCPCAIVVAEYKNALMDKKARDVSNFSLNSINPNLSENGMGPLKKDFLERLLDNEMLLDNEDGDIQSEKKTIQQMENGENSASGFSNKQIPSDLESFNPSKIEYELGLTSGSNLKTKDRYLKVNNPSGSNPISPLSRRPSDNNNDKTEIDVIGEEMDEEDAEILNAENNDIQELRNNVEIVQSNHEIPKNQEFAGVMVPSDQDIGNLLDNLDDEEQGE